jgi:hypothetical protein
MIRRLGLWGIVLGMALAFSGCERLSGPDLTPLAAFGEARVATTKAWPDEDRDALLAFMAEPGVIVSAQGFAWRFLVRQEAPNRGYDPRARVLATHQIEVPGIGVVHEADPKYGPTPLLPPEVLGPVWAEILPKMHEAERVQIAVTPWVADRGVGAEAAPDGRLYFLEITLFSVTPY